MTWNTQSGDTVSVLLAGPQERVDLWYQTVSGESGLRVSAVAYSGNDFLAKLGGAQDVILLDATCFEGPQGLMNSVTKIESPAYVFLPGDIEQEELASLQNDLDKFPHVKKTFVGDANLPQLLKEIYAVGQAQQSAAQGQGWGGNDRSSGGNTPVSTRIITVWNHAGGVGKTTITSNLGYLAAERGYKTLLVGLDGPDNLPLYIDGLKARPNLTTWQSNPTAEGLRATIQKASVNLHVVAGFPDSFLASEYMEIEEHHQASLSNLVGAAIKEEYAVILLDAPSTQGAASAIAAANALVLVSRPENAYRTMVAYKTVTERLGGLHRITPGKIRVVINQYRRGVSLSPDEFHARVTKGLQGSFTPVVAVIPDIHQVIALQQERVLPAQRNTAFREALLPLANGFFADQGSRENGHAYKEERKILGIKVRW